MSSEADGQSVIGSPGFVWYKGRSVAEHVYREVAVDNGILVDGGAMHVALATGTSDS